MRALVAVVVLSVAAFHSGLSAFLEVAENEEKTVQYDSLTELQKIDQKEFEAVQKEAAEQKNEPMQFEAAQKEDVIIVNVTVDNNEDDRFLEALKDGCVEEHQGPADVNTGGDGNYEAAATQGGSMEIESKSSEEIEEHRAAVTESASSSEELAQDSSSEQDEEE